MKTPEPASFEILSPGDLSAAQTGEMFQLLAQHFEGVTPSQFAADLGAKNCVVFVRRGTRLVGFSTMLAYETSNEGEPVSILYSGDTIVAQEAWGSTALARGWITAVNQLRERFPRGRYYWLLLTSGFRTYRFLPVFWREFFPRFDASTPSGITALRNQLARDRFGRQFDPHSGIVRFNSPQRLRGDLKTIPAGRAIDPHISFFAAQNPGCELGDELVCLTDLCHDNLTAAGRRMIAPQLCES